MGQWIKTWLRCRRCWHKIADHYAYGCQHLTPVYRDGRLVQHDKCKCRRTPSGALAPPITWEPLE